MKFILLFISIFTIPAFAQETDEWDIFNEADSSVAQPENNFKYQSQYSIRTDLRKQNQNPDSVLNPNGDIFNAEQMYGLLQFNTRQEVRFKNILKFVFDGSAAGILEKHENATGYTDNSIFSIDFNKKYTCVAYSEFLILKEIYLEYNILKNLYIDAGLLGVNYGSNWMVNPVNYIAKYYSSQLIISDKLYYSIPSLKAGLLIGRFKISLLYIPWIKSNDRQYMDGMMNYTPWQNPGHIVILKNDIILNNNKLSFFLYGEKSKTGSDEEYGGTGIELLCPLFNRMNMNLQGSYTNGNASYKIRKYNYNSTDYYFLEEGSRKDFYFSGLLGFNLVILKSMDMGINYLYNQAGLSKGEYEETAKGLGAVASSGAYRDFTDPNAGFLYSILGIYDPFRLRQNYLFISLSKSNILDFLLFSINSAVCIDDFSMLIHAMITANYWENIDIYADAMISTGARYNVFGMNPVNGQFNAGVKMYF